MASQQILLSTKAADLMVGYPTYGNGSHPLIYMFWDLNNPDYQYRGVIEFDLTQLVPQQASQIVQARLRVSFNGELGGHVEAPYNISCHRLTHRRLLCRRECRVASGCGLHDSSDVGGAAGVGTPVDVGLQDPDHSRGRAPRTAIRAGATQDLSGLRCGRDTKSASQG